MAVSPRYITSFDVENAIADGSKIPASSIPFGTTSGTVADGASVTAATDAANAASTLASQATATAASAVSTSNAAVVAASSAAGNASAALAKATEALTTAGSVGISAAAATASAATASTQAAAAIAAANAASSSASTAASKADAATSAATNAAATAASAVTTANSASSSVAGAVAAANGAASTATTASTTAANAVTTATAAQAAAVTAGTKADTAKAAADAVTATAADAVTRANTAISTANAAKAAVSTIASISIDSQGFHALMPDGSKLNFVPDSITPPPATVTIYPLASAGAVGASLFPNTFLSLDAALPASQAAVISGTPGIQLDSDGNVLSLIEPITKARANAGYGRTQLVSGGPGGFPFFHSTPGGYNNAYDALQLDPNLGTPMFGPEGGTWTVLMVMRQTDVSASGLMAVRTDAGVNITILGAGGDGHLRIEQNNGAAVGTEPSTGATALQQYQVVIFTCDGTKFAIYRNGIQTYVTPTGTIGGLNVAPALFEFLNNAQADVSLIEAATGVPSIAQMNARVAALGARYNITVSTVTIGPANPIPPVPVDYTATYYSKPNLPISDTLPTITGQTVGNGLTLAGGATQMFSVVFGSGQSGANIVTDQAVLDRFYTSYLVGDQTDPLSIINSTGTSNPPFISRARTYLPTDPNRVHLMAADGLHLRSIASKNRTDASYGNVRSGLLRLPTVFKPGCVIKIRYKRPAGPKSWWPIWLYSGEQRTPGPGGNPFGGYGTNQALIRTAGSGRPHEIDINDQYSRVAEGTAIGTELDFGTPDIYGMAWTGSAPHNVYHATSAGFTWFPSGNPEYLRNSNTNFATGFHNLVLNWRDDGSHFMDVMQDGVTVITHYMEYDKADTYVDQNNVTQTMGMHLLIGNQTVATFTPGWDSVVDNEGITDGWTGIIQEISAWRGNIANPDSYRPV